MIYSDSKYVTGAFNLGWIENWRVSGWRNAAKTPVAKQDLWHELLATMDSYEITWQWVKGHADNPLNNHTDALAQIAARSEFLLADTAEAVLTIVARH
ncbi:MAG: RNase H family protein [Pseudodesulfovibrio sp.]|jgi:ribonuclease HI|uniref:RNase H family protein n=1 Tax=Pseudodesulfovibrio sp. TaxID=2035812 RepID=UPI003D10B70B